MNKNGYIIILLFSVIFFNILLKIGSKNLLKNLKQQNSLLKIERVKTDEKKSITSFQNSYSENLDLFEKNLLILKDLSFKNEEIYQNILIIISEFLKNPDFESVTFIEIKKSSENVFFAFSGPENKIIDLIMQIENSSINIFLNEIKLPDEKNNYLEVKYSFLN
jgi:hypothetical protein